jgi:hypothetical protein
MPMNATFGMTEWNHSKKSRTVSSPVNSRFKFLDAAQLVKHAFGMVTEGRRKQKASYLVYLFAEPAQYLANWAAHRAEIATFAHAVKDSEVSFAALSYRDWLAAWPVERGLSEHRDNILRRFEP